jgi:CheY-like chemotaxis protein
MKQQWARRYSGWGFKAEFVSHSEDFFSRLAESSPDFITIDLVMPDLDGVEIMRLLAERNCSSRIIISSGVGTRVLDAAKRSALEHGLDIVGVIAKPISREILRLLVGEGWERGLIVPEKKEALILQETKITAADLQLALDRHEFAVVYQPKIQCESGTPAGFEALARWKHPERGIIMPGTFISDCGGGGVDRCPDSSGLRSKPQIVLCSVSAVPAKTISEYLRKESCRSSTGGWPFEPLPQISACPGPDNPGANGIQRNGGSYSHIGFDDAISSKGF